MKNLPVLCLLPLFLLGCGSTNEAPPVANIRPVKYAAIQQSGGEANHTFSGIAQAEKEAKLSFRVSGTINRLNVKLGDRVRKGQLIASLDPIDYAIQVDQASASEKGSEANLQSAETTLLAARANYQRIERLYENNSVPLSEFEQARSNYETAQAQFEASQTQVTSARKQSQAARNQVNYTRITAPFSGVITAVNVEANELVGSGNPIAILSSTSQPEINVGIPENLIASIKTGQKASIRFSVLPNQVFDGSVQEVSYTAGNTPTYPAIVRIEKASEAIRPGMAANVTFSIGSSETVEQLISPVKAIGNDADGDFAFVLTENNDAGNYKVSKRSVRIGDLTPKGFIVLDGLQKGELVATAGIKSLLDGMEVTLLEE